MYRRAEHTRGAHARDPVLMKAPPPRCVRALRYTKGAGLDALATQVPVAKSKRKRNRRTLATASSTPTLPGASNVHD